MENRIKQCVGIDCSQSELVCSFGMMKPDFSEQIISNATFKNTPAGFKKLLSWADKLAAPEMETPFVVEATGVYHERMSKFLFDNQRKMIVVLPNKMKAFSRTLSVKTVNDKECAKIIAQFGLEKKLDPWQPPHEVYNQLRQLTRERDQLLNDRTAKKNQLHAELSGAWPNKRSMERIKSMVKMINKHIKEIEQEISDLIDVNEWLADTVKKICSIKGVGMITAVTVLAETNGFNLIRNKNQLVSYAGLDVVEKQSGTSIRGKTHISGKGNKYLRKCLYFPAFTSIKHYDHSKNLYKRLVSKHGIKMKGAVAVQRKLLVLIYTLWKKDQFFDPEYHIKKKDSIEIPSFTN